jgi:membrane-bound lytic murein transglycosylase D
MIQKKMKSFLSMIIIPVILNVLPVSGDVEEFPVPPILENNVTFWKKIYTELSISDGYLHDRDYPLIIYKKMPIDEKSYRQMAKNIAYEKNNITGLLTMIATQNETEWNSEARRIAGLFKTYAPDSAIQNAEERIRFQQGQKERFKEGIYRSGAYIDTIKQIFAAYHIPLCLAYLPHVESSFNTDAYSKVGAAGLWQFMQSTGKQFLHINYYIDERRDPVLATYAAAKLLVNNYNQLQSWPLAITAYNHGVNGMKRAIEQTGSRDINIIIQKYSASSFQFASKNFYSCFLAASDIARNTKEFFPDIVAAPPLHLQNITLEYYVSPTTLANNLKVPLEDLQRFNPAIRPTIFRSNKLIPKGTTVHIPGSVLLASAKKALEEIPDSLKISTAPLSDFYRVRYGDNIYSIAKSLGVAPLELAKENNITLKNRIFAGQVLRVPIKQGTTVTQMVVSITKVQKKQPKSGILAPTPATIETVLSQKKVSGPPRTELLILKDTLKDILLTKADTIPQGIPTAETAHSSQFDASMYNLDAAFTPGNKTATILIAINETIGHYAEWLDIPTTRIRILNKMGRGSTVHLYQKLSIPIPDSQALITFNTRRLEYHMALEEDFYTQFKVIDIKLHYIEKGETLWDICNSEDQIPLWLFKKFNKTLNLDQLPLQTRIYIPIIEDKPENSPGSGYDSNFMIPHNFPSRPFQVSP